MRHFSRAAFIIARTTTLAAFIMLTALTSCTATKTATQLTELNKFCMPAVKENPRTSEGDFAKLRNGDILMVYTKFSGGGDADYATISARTSTDNGSTWGEERTIAANEGGNNVMSASLLRLKNKDLALFYLVKNSQFDCYPVMRTSRDEGTTWSDPTPCIPPASGYFVLNNSRVIQLGSGRIVVPVARHAWTDGTFILNAEISCYCSDDNGRTWFRSKEVPAAENVIFQEPGLVELRDGTLLMYIRTDARCQYFATSTDGGITWSKAEPSALTSPLSPSKIIRDPYNKRALIAIWNDNPTQRTAFTIAVSYDNGGTWTQKQIIKDDGEWCCYPALLIPKRGTLLVSYCFGPSRIWGLGAMNVQKFAFSHHNPKK